MSVVLVHSPLVSLLMIYIIILYDTNFSLFITNYINMLLASVLLFLFVCVCLLHFKIFFNSNLSTEHLHGSCY